LAQLFQCLALLIKQIITVTHQQSGPGIGRRHDAGLVIGRVTALIGHLQEQKIRQLLHVVAIAHAIIAQNAAIVPKLLDEGVGGGVQGFDLLFANSEWTQLVGVCALAQSTAAATSACVIWCLASLARTSSLAFKADGASVLRNISSNVYPKARATRAMA